MSSLKKFLFLNPGICCMYLPEECDKYLFSENSKENIRSVTFSGITVETAKVFEILRGLGSVKNLELRFKHPDLRNRFIYRFVEKCVQSINDCDDTLGLTITVHSPTEQEPSNASDASLFILDIVELVSANIVKEVIAVHFRCIIAYCVHMVDKGDNAYIHLDGVLKSGSQIDFFIALRPVCENAKVKSITLELRDTPDGDEFEIKMRHDAFNAFVDHAKKNGVFLWVYFAEDTSQKVSALKDLRDPEEGNAARAAAVAERVKRSEEDFVRRKHNEIVHNLAQDFDEGQLWDLVHILSGVGKHHIIQTTSLSRFERGRAGALKGPAGARPCSPGSRPRELRECY